MKKAALLFALAGLVFCGIPSCKKEEQHKQPVSKTINVTLKANEAYTFSLPENERNDEYRFTTQAGHYSISSLGTDASGNRIYQYTPALDYTGTDVVVVSNAGEKADHPEQPGSCSGKPHPHHGDCDGNQEDHYIVTINFTIENNSTTTEK